jgi:MATE family multidrug resistance protein
MVALISANLVHVVGNWVLIYGNLGAPAMGAAGAGWSTCLSGWYMALFLLAVVVQHDREERPSTGPGLLALPLRPEAERLRRLLRLGFPAASQMIVEVAAFAAATTLAGRLEPRWLAAHQIGLVVISTTFMVPLGISSAAAVRVGQWLGRRDGAGAATAGWTALLFSTAFMLAAAAVLLAAPRPIVRLFSGDERVLATGASLLAIAALFQLFDGAQVVATGALRGAGDTRTPLLWNLVGHWLLGLPIGYYLCFARGWGAVGLWIGWLVGLTFIGAVLLVVWSRVTRRMARELCAVAG